MSIDGFEDWDEAFLDQLVQAEELALSSTNPTQLQRHHPPPPHPRLPAPCADVSYSPPRELSQRLPHNPRVLKSSNGPAHAPVRIVAAHHNDKESETDKLKKELTRVSNQLSLLEEECLELRKERDKKEEQIKSVRSGFEAKHNDARSTKSRDIIGDSEFHIQNNNRAAENPSLKNVVCKTIGVQTDNNSESINLNLNDDDSLSTSRQHCSEKLKGVWDRPASSWSVRNLVSSFFVACESEFLYLFRCSSSNLPLKTTVEEIAAHKVETAKVSRLLSLLTKINNGMVTVDALLDALVDLCRVENVDIVFRSTRILASVLNHCCTMTDKSLRRDNVTVEQPHSSLSVDDVYGSEPDFSEIQMTGSFYPDTIFKKTRFCLDEWVSIFQLMHQIATKNKEDHVRKESLSFMNMILMRTDAYSERDRFGNVVVFQSFSQLLRKDAGLDVQIPAVQLLYLLLNCPKVLAIFCSSGKEDMSPDSDPTNGSVFEGLADCLASDESCVQGLKLRRKTIILLAYLASSGKSGFEILLGLGLSKGINFLVLILQVLISETELEAASELVHPSEIFKERTLLIREAVIVMNRLVSNPQYSGQVLRLLTSTREVASLTVEVACRLSRKVTQSWQLDTTIRQIRETEIVELGSLFRKRVFIFLGDDIS